MLGGAGVKNSLMYSTFLQIAGSAEATVWYEYRSSFAASGNLQPFIPIAARRALSAKERKAQYFAHAAHKLASTGH